MRTRAAEGGLRVATALAQSRIFVSFLVRKVLLELVLAEWIVRCIGGGDICGSMHDCHRAVLFFVLYSVEMIATE